MAASPRSIRRRVARAEAGGVAEGERAAGRVGVPRHLAVAVRPALAGVVASGAQEARVPCRVRLARRGFAARAGVGPLAARLTVQRISLTGVSVVGEVFGRAHVATASRPEQ